MFNKLIFFLFVTLGLTVIVLCIYKSTKIEEHYKTNNVSYADVILPCDNIEMKKSTKIDHVIKIIKSYDVDHNDIKLIKEKINEKGNKGRICDRALKLILDTYLIYYKPILPSILEDLKNKTHQTKKSKNLDEEEEEAIEPEKDELDEDKDEEEQKDINDDFEDDYNLDPSNNNIACNNLDSIVTVLESDGFITKINKKSILKYYDNKCSR